MTRGAGRSAAGGVRVTFYTRAAAGGEWRQVAERTFGSARGCEEFVGSLDVSDEPSVLRALMVYRDEARTHEWLCDRAVSPRPARIDPTFGWSLDDKAAVWAAGRPWTDAWEACPSPDWLLIAANAARVEAAGVLRPILSGGVSVVNARSAAKERGIEITETRRSSSWMVPVFTGTTPIRLFSSVVLPTPLRPSTTVTSPCFASKPRLRRMWLPP